MMFASPAKRSTLPRPAELQPDSARPRARAELSLRHRPARQRHAFFRVCGMALAASISCTYTACIPITGVDEARVADPPPVARDPEISATMRSLLRDTRELREILLRPERLPDAPDIERMQTLLSKMDATVERLDRMGGAGTHPLLASNLAEFQTEVRYARAALEKQPPDFLQVAIVPGACVYCHVAPPR